jgi:phosphatidylserine/phosphatidylglycerophosphate/cardiolipin synthase-like enzyme
MIDSLTKLNDADLRELINALRSDRLGAPFTTMGVERIIGSPLAAAVSTNLQKLAEEGFTSSQIARTIELMVQTKSQGSLEDLIDVVTTGPEAPGITNRDTSVVVRELFFHAQHSVLVAGYAVYQGQRVFQALAARMELVPEMKVRLVLDIQRGPGDSAGAREVSRRFADRFRNQQWPKNGRTPELYYDPRSLELDPVKKACMHAKCIVIDRKIVFVSSANFTEAAQERNVEVGLLIRSTTLAERVQSHFDSLIGENLLVPLPG